MWWSSRLAHLLWPYFLLSPFGFTSTIVITWVIHCRLHRRNFFCSSATKEIHGENLPYHRYRRYKRQSFSVFTPLIPGNHKECDWSFYLWLPPQKGTWMSVLVRDCFIGQHERIGSLECFLWVLWLPLRLCAHSAVTDSKWPTGNEHSTLPQNITS